METFRNSEGQTITTLSCEDVIDLHNILCQNYELLPEMEPISPTGIKDNNMLESAVSRQLVGTIDFYKYKDIYLNCATLVFGIVKNHAFYNGNKRVAFLCLIKHLYVNSLVLKSGISHQEIYELLRLLADNNLKEHSSQFNYTYHKTIGRKNEWTPDLETEYLAHWLKKNTVNRQSQGKLKPIPIQELRRILRNKNIELHQDGNWIYIKKARTLIDKLFNDQEKIKKINIKNQKEVSPKVIQNIRDEFGVSFFDGYDNIAFYNDKEFISAEITAYKRIIYRLAKT